MNFVPVRSGMWIRVARNFVTLACALSLLPGDVSLWARPQSSSPAAPTASVALPPEQLDSLVAPIALYPDPLLSQTLVASTYPLEIVQLQQWLEKNKGLKDAALAEAVKKQDWDPSIQASAALPDVVKRLSENIKWTTDLGNAFLAQQSDVMDAVQRMRNKAQSSGNLKSTEQQKVEVQTVESKPVIVIQQAQPEVVYVPSYDPVVVYGAPAYPYPPLYYPPAGYYAAGMALSFGLGVAMGAAWGGGWGWNSGWGGNNNITVNRNNAYVNHNNRQNANISNRPGNGNNWQHNPKHRGGAPYSNRDVANRFGGTTRGDSMGARRDSARQNQAQRGGLQQAGNRGSVGNRDSAGARDRNTAGTRQQRSAGDRSSGGRDTSNRGGGDRVGNRSVPSGGSSRGSSAFGGSSGFSGSSARASSARGSSSMGGGGFRGGGGGRGGGRRR